MIRCIKIVDKDTEEKNIFENNSNSTVLHFPIKQLGKNGKGYMELLSLCNKQNIDTIICDRSLEDTALELLWQGISTKRCIFFDDGIEAEVYRKREKKDVYVKERLYDIIASQSDGNPIIQGGWVSSYTGNPFSKREMDEFVKNAKDKITPYIDSESIIAEVGVSSGLTCMAISPLVKKYYGMDISSQTLEKTRERLDAMGISNVELIKGEAIEIDQMKDKNIDFIVINSVAQLFPSYRYFFNVVKKCIDCISDKGIIFLGDILDYERKDLFIEDVKSKKGKGGNRNDLWYPRIVFSQLPVLFEQVYDVEISDKLCSVNNELSDYRYDVIVSINIGKKATVDRIKFEYEYSGISDLRNKAKILKDTQLWEVIG